MPAYFSTVVSGRHNLAIPSRIHRPGFDDFSDFVRVPFQLLLVKTSAPSQGGSQHVLANLAELKALQKIFEPIIPILGNHIEAIYNVLLSGRQDEVHVASARLPSKYIGTELNAPSAADDCSLDSTESGAPNVDS